MLLISQLRVQMTGAVAGDAGISHNLGGGRGRDNTALVIVVGGKPATRLARSLLPLELRYYSWPLELVGNKGRAAGKSA